MDAFNNVEEMATPVIAARYTMPCSGILSRNTRSFNVPVDEVEISVQGGNWMTIHNSSVWKTCRNGEPAGRREPPTFTSAGDDGRDTGHLAELEDFIDAVRAGRKTSRSAVYESYKSMALYEAINESARTGKVVRPEYEFI